MKDLRVTPIKNGTVIDHINPGLALKVLHVLKHPEESSSAVSVAMNVKSKMGKKDIVKIENKELDKREVNKISLIAPKATINIIRNYEVVKKDRVQLQTDIIDIVKCSNPTCISNSNEPVETRFILVNKDPITLKCYYCERETEDIVERII